MLDRFPLRGGAVYMLVISVYLSSVVRSSEAIRAAMDVSTLLFPKEGTDWCVWMYTNRTVIQFSFLPCCITSQT